jgi:hypothetical protein
MRARNSVSMVGTAMATAIAVAVLTVGGAAHAGDVQVVTPPTAAPPAAAPAPAPSSSTTVVNPVSPIAQAPVTPVEPAPVVAPPSKQKVVHADVQEPHNYMATVAVSALMGGLAGLLVGGAIYYLGDQNNAERIGYWAAGGVLVGTGVGLVQVVVQENRADEAVSLKQQHDPAPTYRLALFRTTF